MSAERTEKATPKRRGEARRKGQLAKSADLNATVVLGAALATLALTAPTVVSSLRGLLTDTLRRTSTPGVVTADPVGLGREWATTLGSIVAPILIAAAVAAVCVQVLQNKPNLTATALKPDFKRLNPVTGVKRLVSIHGAIELLKSLGKIAVVGTALLLVIWPQVDRLPALMDSTPSAIGGTAGSLALRIAIVALGVLVPLSIGDLFWQKHQHEKSLKMSKQEIKDEARQADVAPEIKAAIRRKAAQLSRQRMLAQVPGADVIVTNPTHYAVALRYGRDVAAPRVVAKGADLVALRIREIGVEHEIAIVENPPLARSLYAQVEVGDEIPPLFFAAVAEVLAYVYRTSRRKLSWV
jgi:flagellar biosynthetic protein FlhB